MNKSASGKKLNANSASLKSLDDSKDNIKLEAIKNRLERMGLWDKIVERELKSLWKYGVEKISDPGIKASVIDFLSKSGLSIRKTPSRLAKRQMRNIAQHHRMLRDGRRPLENVL